MASFENLIGTRVKETFHKDYKGITDQYFAEGSTRIATLAFDENFTTKDSAALKSFHAGTPYKIDKRKLVALSHKIADQILEKADVKLTSDEREDLRHSPEFQSSLKRFMERHPEQEGILQEKDIYHEVFTDLSKKYFRNKIAKNLQKNLPHLQETLNFNMFFNTDSILTPKELTKKVKEIQQEMITLFLENYQTVLPDREHPLPPLPQSVLSAIEDKKILTSSGLNFALQDYKDITPKQRKAYIHVFEDFANQALLKLIKSEHAFHSATTDVERQNDKIMIASLREAKKTAEQVLRGIGPRLANLSHKYLPDESTAELSTDFDSSLESLNLFELVTLLIHSKTLDDIHRYEIQLLGFMSHLVFAIQSDPHYIAIKNDNTFHIDRVAPDARKFYIEEQKSGEFDLIEKNSSISGESITSQHNILHERSWQPPDTLSSEDAIRYFYIGNREKSILSILIKFFVRSNLMHMNQIYDLWGATFALNHSKAELKENQKLLKNVFEFAKSIGEHNLYTDFDESGTSKPERGTFSIVQEKKGNENSSSLFSPILKVYSKDDNDVGKEIIIHDKNAFLQSLDKNSPMHHDFYDDYRFVLWSRMLYPTILFPEKQQKITKLAEAMQKNRKAYEGKNANKKNP